MVVLCTIKDLKCGKTTLLSFKCNRDASYSHQNSEAKRWTSTKWELMKIFAQYSFLASVSCLVLDKNACWQAATFPTCLPSPNPWFFLNTMDRFGSPYSEEPPKLYRLNRIIIHWSTQLKRNNPGSPQYAPQASPRNNSHTVCSHHGNHHKDIWEQKFKVLITSLNYFTKSWI